MSHSSVVGSLLNCHVYATTDSRVELRCQNWYLSAHKVINDIYLRLMGENVSCFQDALRDIESTFRNGVPNVTQY